MTRCIHELVDLALSVVAPDEIYFDQPNVFELTVTNAGPDDAVGAVVQTVRLKPRMRACMRQETIRVYRSRVEC